MDENYGTLQFDYLILSSNNVNLSEIHINYQNESLRNCRNY